MTATLTATEFPTFTGTLTEALVIDTYHRLVARPGGYVSLTRLRAAVQAPRREVDAALIAIAITPEGLLIPEANRKVLTAADRAAALHFGGEDKHLLSIEAA